MSRLSPEAEYQVRRAERVLQEREARRAFLRERAVCAARALRDEFGATRVWLFGSVRRPWFHEGSDLDLAAEGLPAGRAGEAWDRLGEIVGDGVDLVAIEEADEGLRERILQTGEPIP